MIELSDAYFEEPLCICSGPAGIPHLRHCPFWPPLEVRKVTPGYDEYESPNGTPVSDLVDAMVMADIMAGNKPSEVQHDQ